MPECPVLAEVFCLEERVRFLKRKSAEKGACRLSERASLRKTRGKGPAAQEGIRISDWGLAALLDNARAGQENFPEE